MACLSWNDLRLSKQLCDGTIKTVDGRSYPIHRVILSSFSPYFRAFFTNTLHNGKPENNELFIPDIPSDVIELIIEFAYSQQCAVSLNNVYQLIEAADKLSCMAMVSFCSKFISSNITASNCISILQFAKTFFLKDLEVKAWEFTCLNAHEALLTPEFRNLSSGEVAALLSSDELNVRHEDDVFEAIARWVMEEPETRSCQMYQLLHCVRFGLISREHYESVIKAFPHHTKESMDLLLTIDLLFETYEDCYFYCYSYFRPRLPNEVMFAIGGWSEGQPIDNIETFDKKSESWYMTDLKDPRIRAYHGVACVNNLIYVIGGFDGVEYFSTMFCLDPVTCTWTERAPLHQIRCYVSVCTLGGEIYAIGGFNGRTRLTSGEKYNTETNQWTNIAHMCKQRSDADAAVLGNKIYVAGGFNGMEVLRSVERYCPVSNAWEFVNCLSTPRSGVGLISHGSYIYAVGGYDGVARLYSVERFNPAYNRWDYVSDMQCPRSNMAACILDNRIYVVGGYNGSSTVPFTEYYVEEEDMWVETSSMNVHRSALTVCVCRGLPNARRYTYHGSTTIVSSDQWMRITL